MSAPEGLREDLVGIVVKYGLRELRAMTEGSTMTVSEPGLWEDNVQTKGPDYGLKVEEREHEL